MTYAQGTGLSAAVLGAVGTMILFRSSYAFRPLEGGIFGSPALTEYNNRIKDENRRRHSWQRIGLGFLCLSFVVQAISSLL
jgi:zinc transporter ZupT